MKNNSGNFEIFYNHFNKIHSNYIFWQNALNDKEPLVVILTSHLMCENFLEAYICSCLNVPDLFDENVHKKEGKVPFKMQFSQKLKLAQRLGLPMPAYDLIDKLNSLRNKFAHNLNAGVIEKSFIISLTSLVNKIEPKSQSFEEHKEGVQIFSKSGEVDKTFIFSDEDTPNTIRLVILYSFLIRKLIHNFNL